MLLEHRWRIFVRVEMNSQQTEVTFLPFYGLDGEVKDCRLVVQCQRKGIGRGLDCFEGGL